MSQKTRQDFWFFQARQIQFSLILIVAVFVIAVAQVARAGLLFETGFEDQDLSWSPTIALCCDHSAQLVQDKVRSGNQAIKFTLHSDDPMVRAELMKFGTDQGTRWYGLSLYIDPSWQDDTNDPNGTIVAQWHGVKDDGEAARSPYLSLQITKDNKWMLRIRYDAAPITTGTTGRRDYALGPVTMGQWVDWVFQAKWSYGSDGVLKAWKDGTQVVNDTGPNTFNDVKPGYFKFGIYKAWWGHELPPTRNTMVAYYDEVKIGDAASNYQEIEPLPAEDPPTIHFFSGAEQGCPGEWGNSSQCLDNGVGLVVTSQEKVLKGSTAFKHPANPAISNQTGKLNTFDSHILDVLDASLHNGAGQAYFSVWYYIDRGYNDPEWRVNMQWKMALPSTPGQNPKVALGFVMINGVRQVNLSVKSVGTYFQSDPKPVPTGQWFQLEVFLKTSTTDGQVVAWQDGTEIFNVSGINTLTQILRDGPWSENNSLYFSIGNYLSLDAEPIEQVVFTDEIYVTDKRMFGPSSPVPQLTLTATPSTLFAGDSVVLSWTAQNVTQCAASGGWNGAKAVNGSETLTPVLNTDYTLTCTGDSGEATETVAVTVNPSNDIEQVIGDATFAGDSGNLTDPTRLPQNLWDGNVSSDDGSTGNAGIASFYVDFDLKQLRDLTLARLFGDDQGTWLCHQWRLEHRSSLQDNWTQAVSSSCAARKWHEAPLNHSARYLRVTVEGAPEGTQAFELEVYALKAPSDSVTPKAPKGLRVIK